MLQLRNHFSTAGGYTSRAVLRHPGKAHTERPRRASRPVSMALGTCCVMLEDTSVILI